MEKERSPRNNKDYPLVKVSEFSYIKQQLIEEANDEFKLTKQFVTPPRITDQNPNYMSIQIDDLEQKIY